MTGNTVAFGTLSNTQATALVGGLLVRVQTDTGPASQRYAPRPDGQQYDHPGGCAGEHWNRDKPDDAFAATNFDTLYLDGVANGSKITGAISDAPTGSLAANGLDEDYQERHRHLDDYCGGDQPRLYSVFNGTLKLGINNGISTTGQGTNVTAAAGTATNTVIARD